MLCKERTSLLTHYQKRVRAYAHAVGELRLDRATSQNEFRRLWNLADLALRACSASQRQLDRHMADHKCYLEGELMAEPDRMLA